MGGTVSRKCSVGCTCGRHNKVMLAERSAARRGRKDDETTRERKSAAAFAAWARRTDHATHTRPATAAKADDKAKAHDAALRLERSNEFRYWLDRMLGKSPPDQMVMDTAPGLEGHRDMANRLGVHIVSRGTLRKYGLTEMDWLAMASMQGWVCPICQRRTRKFVTDHEHVPGWAKRPPDERKRYVRGLLCVYCNFRVVPSRMTAEEAYRMVAYLAAYENRRDT